MLDRGNVKAQDLLLTGADGLRAQGGESLSTLIDRIVEFCQNKPQGARIAIVNAWADRLEALRKEKMLPQPAGVSVSFNQATYFGFLQTATLKGRRHEATVLLDD